MAWTTTIITDLFEIRAGISIFHAEVGIKPVLEAPPGVEVVREI
jgi:hypothetical protein